MIGLLGVRSISTIYLVLLTQYWCVADGRTDRHPDRSRDIVDCVVDSVAGVIFSVKKSCINNAKHYYFLHATFCGLSYM